MTSNEYISDGGYSHREHSLINDTYQYCNNYESGGNRVIFVTGRSDYYNMVGLRGTCDSFQFLDKKSRLYITEPTPTTLYRIKYYQIPKGILNNKNTGDISNKCTCVDTGITTSYKFVQDSYCIGGALFTLDTDNNSIIKYTETDEGLTYSGSALFEGTAISATRVMDYIYLITNKPYECRALDVDTLQWKDITTVAEFGRNFVRAVALDYTVY